MGLLRNALRWMTAGLAMGAATVACAAEETPYEDASVTYHRGWLDPDLFEWIFGRKGPETSASAPTPTKPFHYVLGTQAIGPAYHFTEDPPVLEAAKAIHAMGSRIVKVEHKSDEELSAVLRLPFHTFFIWWSNSKIWRDGLNAQEADATYQSTFHFARKLLLDHQGSGKTFLLGHWEGDWLLVDGTDGQADPPPTAVEGMIAWLQVRQRAIDDAKRSVPHGDVRLYHYAEVNRVRDAMGKKKPRMVNEVLPHVDVDYVSYSSYDVQKEPYDTVQETLDYIQGKLKPKAGLPEKRVFIGEFGISAEETDFDGVEHERRNRDILLKFLRWGCPYVLYWSMYNNEVIHRDPKTGKRTRVDLKKGPPPEDGELIQRGFWLVDDKNRKQPLYHTFQRFFQDAERFVESSTLASGTSLDLPRFLSWASHRLESVGSAVP